MNIYISAFYLAQKKSPRQFFSNLKIQIDLKNLFYVKLLPLIFFQTLREKPPIMKERIKIIPHHHWRCLFFLVLCDSYHSPLSSRSKDLNSRLLKLAYLFVLCKRKSNIEIYECDFHKTVYSPLSSFIPLQRDWEDKSYQ